MCPLINDLASLGLNSRTYKMSIIKVSDRMVVEIKEIMLVSIEISGDHQVVIV